MQSKFFQLVFCGGTCLAKAHAVIKRMSEDIDFKIQVKNVNIKSNKTLFLKKLKEFRLQIKTKLAATELSMGDIVVCNEGQYWRIELEYPSVFYANPELRPHILLEFTLSEVYLVAVSLPIKTLMEHILENVSIFTPTAALCISIDEAAIEKWVGLTRRVVAIERACHHDDKTLIRHLYDLNVIKQVDGIGSEFFTLASVIISNDANQFKNQHLEYFISPSDEIKQSIILLKNKALWRARYQEFIETMVYDTTVALDYEGAIDNLEHISAKIVNLL